MASTDSRSRRSAGYRRTGRHSACRPREVTHSCVPRWRTSWLSCPSAVARRAATAVQRTDMACQSRSFRKLHRQSTATEGAGVDSEWNVSALMAKSLTWDRSAFARAPARHPRRRFENEAVAWQLASQRGGWAAFRSVCGPVRRPASPAEGPEPDRRASCHDRGHRRQAGLCWGFEQDAQRFDATRNKITEEHHRLVLRALSEVGGHFLLGAAHSLGNLGLRIALLDPQAGPAIQAARPKADFAPGSDDKRAWLSLSVSSEILAKAASGSANIPLARISAAVSELVADPRHVALDSRRAWTTTGSARSLSRTPRQSAASHRQATASSRSISLVPCSIPKPMQTGSTTCSSRPWRRSGRPW